MSINFSDAQIGICEFDGFHTLCLYRFKYETYVRDYFQLKDDIYAIVDEQITKVDLSPQKIKAYAKINPDSIHYTRMKYMDQPNFRVCASIGDIKQVLTRDLTHSIFGRINLTRLRRHFPIYRSQEDQLQILPHSSIDQIQTALVANKNQYMQVRERDFLYSVTGDFYISIVNKHIEDHLFDLFSPSIPELFVYTNPVSLKYLLDRFSRSFEKPTIIDGSRWYYMNPNTLHTTPHSFMNVVDFHSIENSDLSTFQLGMGNLNEILTREYEHTINEIDELVSEDVIS